VNAVLGKLEERKWPDWSLEEIDYMFLEIGGNKRVFYLVKHESVLSYEEHRYIAWALLHDFPNPCEFKMEEYSDMTLLEMQALIDCLDDLEASNLPVLVDFADPMDMTECIEEYRKIVHKYWAEDPDQFDKELNKFRPKRIKM
jgi:hypothetical protein